MKNQIATDISQSKRLLSCGVDPKTADMSVRTIKEPYCEDMAWHIPKLLTLPYDEAKTIYGDDEITPAWSLAILILLLPHDITDSKYYRLVMGPNENNWEIEYNDLSVVHNMKRVIADTPIEACVQMIEWLTANGYPLNKIEE